jgi:hypothetical protein
VIDQNDLGLVEGLELPCQHGDLDRDRRQEDEIVASQRHAARVPDIGPDEQRQHGAAEQTGPGLLHAEADKFVDEGGERPLRRPLRKLRLGSDKPGKRLPAGGTLARAGVRQVLQA